jgi:hypothetical protein
MGITVAELASDLCVDTREVLVLVGAYPPDETGAWERKGSCLTSPPTTSETRSTTSASAPSPRSGGPRAPARSHSRQPDLPEAVVYGGSGSDRGLCSA